MITITTKIRLKWGLGLGVAIFLFVSLGTAGLAQEFKALIDQDRKSTESLQTKLIRLTNKIGEKERIDFSMNELRLAEFIGIYTKEYKLNVINHAQNIRKSLSIDLKQVHPVNLLDTVLTGLGCGWDYQDNILTIFKHEPVKVIKLKYAKSKDILKNIGSITTLKGVSIDEVNNAIIARGSIESISQLEQVIQKLDKKPLQVLIEAKIIEKTIGKNESYGLNIMSPITDNDGKSRTLLKGFTSVTGNMLSGLYVRNIGNDILTELEASQKMSDTNVLASPKLMVTNHHKASIVTGQRLGYSTITQTNLATIEEISFLDSGIKLDITPHISEDGYIIMEIEPEVSEGQVVDNIPNESTTRTETQIMVQDGQSIVIAGLIKNSEVESVQGVPILSDIPILSLLFEKKTIEHVKREVIIIITPKIIKL